MKERNYPIIFGLNGRANKCLVAKSGENGFYICWTKDDTIQIGDKNFPVDAIGSVIAEIKFCSRDSLRSMIRFLQILDENWVGEEDVH